MPSILEGLPSDGKRAAAALAVAERMQAGVLSHIDMSPRARSIIDLLGEGLSMADILDITPAERDALLTTGLDALRQRDFAAAKDLLAGLVRLEPLDRRAVYALGVAQQGAGDIFDAGRTFVSALALDALDPDSYLRLGECLFANGERDAARGCFEAAKLHAGKAGAAASLAHAERMIAALDAADAT